MYLSIYLSTYLSTYLPIYLSIYLPLSLYLSPCLSVCLSIDLPICKLENEAILRDVLRFWTWQHQKRSNSARLLNVWSWQRPKRSNSARQPQFLNLTMSETKQFCDSSSKLTTSKTKQFCETSFKNGKLSAELKASYQCVLRFFQSMCLNYCACHKKWCQVIRSAAPVTQNNNLSKPEDLMLQNATPLRKSEPGPPNISDEHIFLYCACHAKCIFADPLQMSHACHRFWRCYKTLTFCSLLRRCTIPCACHAKRHLNFQKWREHGVLCTFWLRNVLRATTACTFSTSQLPKVVRSWCVLYILTSKCASRHNGVHFFDISTSKSGPELTCFAHFDFEMCFAPQRRALFHLSSGQMAPHSPL